MNESLLVFAMVTDILRPLLLAAGIVFAVVATVDWAVRTRRINPFSGTARFMRGRVDPRIAGVERQVTRVGGHAASTPWWALVAYVVCAALLLAALPARKMSHAARGILRSPPETAARQNSRRP